MFRYHIPFIPLLYVNALTEDSQFLSLGPMMNTCATHTHNCALLHILHIFTTHFYFIFTHRPFYWYGTSFYTLIQLYYTIIDFIQVTLMWQPLSSYSMLYLIIFIYSQLFLILLWIPLILLWPNRVPFIHYWCLPSIVICFHWYQFIVYLHCGDCGSNVAISAQHCHIPMHPPHVYKGSHSILKPRLV